MVALSCLNCILLIALYPLLFSYFWTWGWAWRSQHFFSFLFLYMYPFLWLSFFWIWFSNFDMKKEICRLLQIIETDWWHQLIGWISQLIESRRAAGLHWRRKSLVSQSLVICIISGRHFCMHTQRHVNLNIYKSQIYNMPCTSKYLIALLSFAASWCRWCHW